MDPIEKVFGDLVIPHTRWKETFADKAIEQREYETRCDKQVGASQKKIDDTQSQHDAALMGRQCSNQL